PRLTHVDPSGGDRMLSHRRAVGTGGGGKRCEHDNGHRGAGAHDVRKLKTYAQARNSPGRVLAWRPSLEGVPMRRWSVVVWLALGAAAVAGAQQSVPEIKFEGNVDFLKLPPNVYLGEVAGVAV